MDMLWLPNMKQVLGKSMWMWFLPFQTEMKGQGFYFPRIPEVSESDIKASNKDAPSGAFTSNDFDCDP